MRPRYQPFEPARCPQGTAAPAPGAARPLSPPAPQPGAIRSGPRRRAGL